MINNLCKHGKRITCSHNILNTLSTNITNKAKGSSTTPIPSIAANNTINNGNSTIHTTYKQTSIIFYLSIFSAFLFIVYAET